MIKKSKTGEYIIRCDNCNYEEQIDTAGDFEKLKIILHETGWKTKHKFKNLCEDCQEELRKDK